MAIFAEVTENECIIISEVMYYGSVSYWPIYITIMTIQYDFFKNPSTNVILYLELGCIAQSQIMTDKNGIERHDVGLCKHVAV